MTVIKFIEDYVPNWLSDKFREECCKQGTWNPHIEAEPMMIGRMLNWSKTKDTRDFWCAVGQIILWNFNKPKEIQALINDVPWKMIKKEETKPEMPEIKPVKQMTIGYFFNNYIPFWLYTEFQEECNNQDTWKPGDTAYPDVIDGMIYWDETKNPELWAEVNEIIRDNFNTPALLQKKLNDIKDKFSPSKPQHKEESSENKETNKMKLDKYVNQTVATVTLVEGVDISDLSPSSIIAQIKANKRAIKDLEEAGISGAYFTQEKTKHELAVSTLQAELNSRASAPASAEA